MLWSRKGAEPQQLASDWQLEPASDRLSPRKVSLESALRGGTSGQTRDAASPGL